MIENVDQIAPLGKSHRSGLYFVFKCYSIQETTFTAKALYHKGDYDEFREEFKQIDWGKELHGKDAENMFAVNALNTCILTKGIRHKMIQLDLGGKYKCQKMPAAVFQNIGSKGKLLQGHQ